MQRHRCGAQPCCLSKIDGRLKYAAAGRGWNLCIFTKHFNLLQHINHAKTIATISVQCTTHSSALYLPYPLLLHKFQAHWFKMFARYDDMNVLLSYFSSSLGGGMKRYRIYPCMTLGGNVPCKILSSHGTKGYFYQYGQGRGREIMMTLDCKFKLWWHQSGRIKAILWWYHHYNP